MKSATVRHRSLASVVLPPASGDLVRINSTCMIMAGRDSLIKLETGNAKVSFKVSREQLIETIVNQMAHVQDYARLFYTVRKDSLRGL